MSDIETAIATAVKQQLPLTPDEVTVEWLSDVLGQKVKSTEFTQKTLLATASKLHITITYDDPVAARVAGKPTYICIKGGFNPEMIKQYGHTGLIAIYKREAEFFSKVAPTISRMNLVRCYWAGSDSNQGIVILDDLASPEMGMSFGEPTAAWPVSRVLAGVEQLASLHASAWGASYDQYPWLVNQYDQTFITLCGMWKDMMLAEGRPPHPADWNEQRITAVFKKLFDTRNNNTSLPHCLLHGDPHVGNTYIDKNGAPGFLDWQLIHIGSPFHDVAYFVVGAMTVSDRKAHEMDILKHYLVSLEKLGGPVLGFEEARVEYRKYILAGIGWMLTPYGMQPKERVLAMSERYLSAIVDHQAVELIESL